MMNIDAGMLLTIVTVMVTSGALGGLVGRFLAEAGAPGAHSGPDEAAGGGPTAPLPAWKHVLIGITAALMVPLFLTMISSDLILNLLRTPDNPSGLLNLAGFCLVAAVSSRGFISSLSDRLLREVRQAQAQAEQAAGSAADAQQQAVDAATTAHSALEQASAGADLVKSQWIEEAHPEGAAAPADNGAPRSRGQAAPAAPALPAADLAVLRLLARPPATLRLPVRLAAEAAMDEQDLEGALARLQARGWAGQVAGSDRQPRWFATASGRAAAA
ncbi:MAG: hypothetical protein RLZZ592_350 [Pseudomonadota bacterium]|jgi:hypothetical protein